MRLHNGPLMSSKPLWFFLKWFSSFEDAWKYNFSKDFSTNVLISVCEHLVIVHDIFQWDVLYNCKNVLICLSYQGSTCHLSMGMGYNLKLLQAELLQLHHIEGEDECEKKYNIKKKNHALNMNLNLFESAHCFHSFNQSFCIQSLHLINSRIPWEPFDNRFDAD